MEKSKISLKNMVWGGMEASCHRMCSIEYVLTFRCQIEAFASVAHDQQAARPRAPRWRDLGLTAKMRMADVCPDMNTEFFAIPIEDYDLHVSTAGVIYNNYRTRGGSSSGDDQGPACCHLPKRVVLVTATVQHVQFFTVFEVHVVFP